jgi:PAS domain S-box-containing protein
MVQDVTERTRAEEALKGEKEFTETALNAQTDTFFVFEPSTGKAVRWNKAFNRISGYSDEEIRSMKAPDSYYNEQDLKKAAAATERVLEEGVASVELSLITKDGRPIPTEYTASAIRDGNGNPKYIIAVGRDITERKQAAEVLRESEEKYRAIFEEAADSIVLVDPATGGLVEFNDRTSEMLGYTREELGKLTIADLDVVESAEEVANHIKKVLRKGGDTFETKRRAKNGAILDILVNCRTISIGGRDLILSIWRDITEQKRVQRQVRSLARFPSENPNPVLRISKDCTIVYANEPSLPVLETWERRQGQRLPEVCGQRVKEALSSGKVRTFEFECKDGRAFFVTLAPVADGSYANAYGVDITERRQAEEQVRRARDEWERTFNSVPDLIAIVDSNYRIQRVNRAMAERLGCEPEQAVGLTCYEVVHGTDAPPEFCPHRRLVVDGKEHSAEIHEDKLGGDFIISVSPLCSDDGELMGSVHVARDITDRVQAEHALRESEAKHRALVEQVPAISYTAALDEECTTLYISPQVEQILGFTPQEWQQEKDKWVQQLSPEDRERVLSEWESSRAAGTQFVSEYRVMARDGRAVWVRDEAVVVSDDKGRPICVQGLMFDITERKRAEQALKESEEKFRNLAEQSPNMIFINKGGKVAYANARCEEVMGYKREEFYSPNFDFLSLIAPESRDLIKRSYRRHLKGGDVGPVEYALVTREGERIDAILTTKLIQYDGGKAILGTVTDITERKRAEEALRESENRFQTLARLSPVGIFRTDGEGNCLYVNERWCDIAGLSREEALTEGWAGGLHPEDRKRVYERWHESVRENIPFREEYRFKRSDGEANWVFGQATPERDENGYVVGYIGTITDITERKQAEEALRQSEQKHRHLIETMKEGLGVTDQNYIFTYVNDSFCEMLGYSRDEMLGHHQIEFIDDDYKGLMKEQIAKRIKGEARSYEMGWRAKDGRTVYTLISPAAFFDASGNFTGSLAALTDITERKEAEVCQQLTGEVLQVLNQESRARELIRAVLDLIRAATGFAAVGIRLREGEDFPYFEVNGFSDDFVEAENYLCARDEKGELIRDLEGRPLLECMCGNILSGRTDPALPFFTEGGSFWTNSTTRLLRSTTSRERQGGTRNRCNQAGYESVALIPLRWGEQIVGLLQLNDNWPGRFTPEMIRFFEGMCTSIGIALARIRAEENIESVAKFPSEDPYPVLRVAADGTVLYTNSAGSELLKEWRCDVGTYVPRQWYQYIRRILESGLRGELETACGDRVFSLTAAPIVKAGYVNIYGTDITERKQAEEDLREYRQHLERLVQARTVELTEINEELLQQIEQRKQLEREILDISEREKRLIGQELHDSIGQQFTGIAFMTKVLEQRLAARLPDEAGSAAAIAKLVNQAMEQARGLAKGLHPMDLDGGSLVSALRELVRTTERLFGVHCTFKCEKAVWVEDGANAVHLYRIAQEAVTNAIKHGKARHIRMKLAGGSDQSVLTIQNDGVDFPEKLDEKGAGMGLHIMNHRVEIIGGSLDIRSGPEGGTVVTCAFPNTKP